MPQQSAPVGAPNLAIVEESERYSGPAEWVAPQLARDLAPICGVEVVALDVKRRWFGMRERMEVRVRGPGDAVARFWRELEEAADVRRGVRFSLWDVLWP